MYSLMTYSSRRFSYNDEEKVKKNIMRYKNATITCRYPIIRNLFYSIWMWNMTPDEPLRIQVFKNRTKEL